jgi:hypothetical protein
LRCFAHARENYRRGRLLYILESELVLIKCPPSLIQIKII